MKTVRITAKTIDEAVEEGIRQLGIPREEAVIHVVSQPSSGLFRLIHKKMAVVDVSAPEESSEKPAAPSRTAEEAPAEKAEETSEVKTEEAPAEKTEAAPAAQEEPQAEEHAVPEKAEMAPQEAAPEKTEEAPVEENEPAESVPAENASGDEETGEEAKKNEFVFSEEEQKETADMAANFLQDVFHGMHLAVTMERFLTPERIRFNLHGEGLGVLIGRHGQTLDALQYLTNLAAGKKYHHHYFVLLDVDDYRERRQKTLESLAKRMAGKVKRTGKPEKLEPMNAADRRIIHLALQDDPSITTESEGEVPYRAVVIRLKKAGE